LNRRAIPIVLPAALTGEPRLGFVPQTPEDPETSGGGRQSGRDSPPSRGIPRGPSEGKCEGESVSAIGSSIGKAGSPQAIAVIDGMQRRDGEDNVASSRNAGQRQASLAHLTKAERGEG
jgi:hypothetical protein